MMMERMKTLDGMRILLLEDDALISIDTHDMLLSIGAGEVLVANSLEDAEAILAAEPIDAAVLDLLIGRSRCVDLAASLLERDVPLIFASGFDDRASLPESLRAVPSVEKPCSAQALRAALLRALGSCDS
jgi:DNA-binding NtrC family response regulator